MILSLDSCLMLVLSAADVERLFHLDLAIESQRAAFTALGRGEAVLPPRLLVPGAEDSVAFCYAARLSPGGAAVSKFGSVNPANVARGLSTVSAVITVLDPADGHPVAVLDGTSVTTLRTSAASAVAASALARPGARTLAVLGSGVQASGHVQALARVLPELAEVRIYSPSAERRLALARGLDSGKAGGYPVRAAASAEAAVRDADIVACCTTSASPVLDPAWLAPGALVTSVGSFEPGRCEVPASLAPAAAAVVVDDVAAAVSDAGPIVAAVASGAIRAGDLVPLGAVITGQVPGRRSDSDVIYYNSVGLGVQDAAAALAIVSAAASTN
jgi:ornithine cyclodeaminase/alanine dehydrogenase-like protein (mu-crystallin family)